MKRHLVIAAAGLLAAFAGSASAMVRSNDLSPAITAQVLKLVPDADLSGLSPAQTTALSQINTNSNDLRTVSDFRAYIRAVLGEN